MNEEQIKNILRESLGKNKLNESYVTTSKKYELSTEMLSEKAKQAHQQTLCSISGRVSKKHKLLGGQK